MKAAPAAESLRRILDANSFDELPDIAAADMPWVLDWLGAVRNIHFQLLYFGADPRAPMRLSPAQMERNVSDYEDEIARVMAFSQKLFPRMLATAHDFLPALPENERASKVRLDGLAKMIGGYLESVEGALAFTAATGTKAANARLLAAALHESAEVWIETAAPDMRQRFGEYVAVACGKTQDKETADHLRAIEAALNAANS